jgi:hypothetical protein
MDNRLHEPGEILELTREADDGAEAGLPLAAPYRPAANDDLPRRRWTAPLRRLVGATDPASDRLLTKGQLVKVGQLVRRFKSEWKIIKSRRLHSGSKEYSVELVMVHPDHGIAIVSVCPSEYALPDLAIEIVRDILRKSAISQHSVAMLPIVFVSAHERSMQEVADELQDAFATLAAPPADGWEKRAYKILSSATYDRLADDFGAEIISPATASDRGQTAQQALPLLPRAVVIYFACSGVGVVAGVVIAVVALLH